MLTEKEQEIYIEICRQWNELVEYDGYRLLNPSGICSQAVALGTYDDEPYWIGYFTCDVCGHFQFFVSPEKKEQEQWICDSCKSIVLEK